MLEIQLHDEGGLLWQAARTGAGAAGAGLVVAGRTATREQTREAGTTVFGDTRILSIGELFSATEARLAPADRPPPASDRLVRLAALDRLLADPETDLCAELRRCRAPADREVLLAWIDRVSARADVEHKAAAATPVEVGVEHLRAALDEGGFVSETRRRAHIARRANQVRLRERLVIGPMPLADPFTSGLLKGLASRQDVCVLGLAPGALVEAWLSEARLGPDWGTATPTPHMGRLDVAGVLYSGRSAEDGVDLLEAGDELQEALIHIRGLIDGGVAPDKITLALARPERDLLRLEQLAARAEVPLLARRAVAATDTPLGTFALAASRPAIDPQELLAMGRPLRLATDEVTEITALTGIARARRIHAMLGPLAERAQAPSELAAREMNWIDAFGAEILVAESIEPAPTCTEIASGARTRSLLVGRPEGVAVVGYAEAQGLERSHLVATGLSDGEWPPRERPSPFISPATVSSCPGLWPADRRVDFASALAAHATTLLVREARDGAGRNRAPSVLYAAAKSAGACIVDPPEQPRRRPRPPKGRRAEVRELARDKTSFSVTELSLYLACPRGWEVKHGLGVAEVEQRSTVRGRITHAMLEEALSETGLSLAERRAKAEAALADEDAAGGIDEPTRAILVSQVTRVIERYSPPRWPFTPLAVERKVSVYDEGLGATIEGRIDRIDEMPSGDLLLVDYKGRRPSWRGPSVLARNLQACLYPSMVAYRLERPVFGTIFISVGHDGYDGLVRRLVPGLDAPTLHRDSSLLADAGRRNMRGAIEGIRAGRFSGEAPGCWAGCPCRSLRLDELR